MIDLTKWVQSTTVDSSIASAVLFLRRRGRARRGALRQKSLEIALETRDRISIAPAGVMDVENSKRTHNGPKCPFRSSRRIYGMPKLAHIGSYGQNQALRAHVWAKNGLADHFGPRPNLYYHKTLVRA